MSVDCSSFSSLCGDRKEDGEDQRRKLYGHLKNKVNNVTSQSYTIISSAAARVCKMTGDGMVPPRTIKSSTD